MCRTEKQNNEFGTKNEQCCRPSSKRAAASTDAAQATPGQGQAAAAHSLRDIVGDGVPAPEPSLQVPVVLILLLRDRPAARLPGGAAPHEAPP